MLAYLDVSYIPKDNLISKLQDIYKDDDDFGDLELLIPDQLNTLLGRLKTNIWFVIERPYVDRHFRDTYYTFHSSKFRKTGRNCLRVHLFEDKITENELLDKNINVNGRYRGFFIIRPLMHHILGRSLISPQAFIDHHFVCCLMEGRISLLGNNLTVKGFPHIAQDTETHTCAESALWSYIEYFGSKHPQYKPLLPSKIIKTLLDSTEHRILPSEGLTINELAKCLNDNGFQCLTHDNASHEKKKQFFQLLRTYVESGIPLLLYLYNKKDAHAVLVIGHETEDSLYSTESVFSDREKPWADVSLINKKMVFIDDNWPPYQTADISCPTAHYKPEINNMEIVSFIVSLPVHVFLVAEKVYDFIDEFFSHPEIGLGQQTLTGEWITRLLLTGSKSFKNFLLRTDEKMPRDFKDAILTLNLPKFIWVCELYRKDDFSPTGHCSGLLLVDATSDCKSFAAVLFFTIDKTIYEPDDRGGALNKHEIIVPFSMCTYKNNLERG